MNIIIVPIDNRPCVSQFPKKLSLMAGFSVKMPPESMLGRFTQAGKIDEILAWLKENVSDDSYLILSSDMMIYGGLIASRSHECTLDECRKRASLLKEFLKLHKFKKIAIFSVLMRTFPTFLNSASIAIASSFKKAMERLFPKDPLPQKEFDLLMSIETSRAGLEEVIPKYLELRNRNHIINKEVCSWKKEGLVDILAIGLDDVVGMGPNIHEEKILRKILEDEKNAFICRGTDELPMTLLSYIASSETGIKPTFSIEYSSEKGSYAKTIYEQKTVREVIEEAIKVANFKIVPRDGDIKIFCNTPESTQKETEFQHLSIPKIKKKFIKLLSHEIKHNKNVALADLAYANGSDISLKNEMLKHIDPLSLYAYAGWNTSGNTAGTVISHAALRYISEKLGTFQPLEHAEFIIERILDDCEYESSVRSIFKIKKTAKGMSILNMSELERAETSMEISSEMQKKAKKLFNTSFKGKHKINSGDIIDIKQAEFFFDLPWPRLFEIKVEAKFSAEIL